MGKRVRKFKCLINLIMLATFPVTLAIVIMVTATKINAAEDEIIVIFNKGISKEALDNLTASVDKSIKVLEHIEEYALIGVRRSHGRILKELKGNPLVKTVQYNHRVEAFKSSEDTYSDAQWVINNPGSYTYLTKVRQEQRVSTMDIDMDVVEAWGQINKDKDELREVVVAVIDTGIDYNHPDLKDRMWTNKNEIPEDGLDNDGNGYIDDIYGWDFYNDDATVCHYKQDENNKITADLEDNDDHGTHIAGIIGAVANNNIGVAGIASNINIKIMALKINGGKNGTGDVANAIEAIKYATMMGADICNLSWGTDQYNEALQQVMKQSNALFITAAGNTGSDNNRKPVYPAGFRLDNQISVTFIDANGKLTELSNYGKTSVDVAAPGVDILSTVVGSYAYMSGSSMAAPHVSAVAAMLYSCNNYLYASNVKEIILRNIKPIESLDGYMVNAGIPSAYRIVTDLASLAVDDVPPVLSFETIYDKGKFLVPVKAEDIGGSGIRTIRWIIGERKPSDFNNGMAGTPVEDNTAAFLKAGTYTFYSSDYAGNDMTVTYEIKDDSEAPQIIPYYQTAGDGIIEVKVRVIDFLSDVKRVKYMEGKKQASDFLPQGGGTEIKLTERMGKFTIDHGGIYSIYAIDNRGNYTVIYLDIKMIKAKEIKFLKKEITLEENGLYYLRAFMKPADTTDVVSYYSTNPEIVEVVGRGKIKALKEGTATIEARTSNGLSATCTVIVIAGH